MKTRLYLTSLTIMLACTFTAIIHQSNATTPTTTPTNQTPPAIYYCITCGHTITQTPGVSIFCPKGHGAMQRR